MSITQAYRKLSILVISLCGLIVISCSKSDINSDSTLSDKEFIIYSVNGITYSYVKPTERIFADSLRENPLFYYDAMVFGDRFSNLPADLVKIEYAGLGTSVGSSQKLNFFYTAQTDIYPYKTTSTAPIMVNITEYGAVGEYISGNFSGLLTGPAPANTQYQVACNFRVKRRI